MKVWCGTNGNERVNPLASPASRFANFIERGAVDQVRAHAIKENGSAQPAVTTSARPPEGFQRSGLVAFARTGQRVAVTLVTRDDDAWFVFTNPLLSVHPSLRHPHHLQSSGPADTAGRILNRIGYAPSIGRCLWRGSLGVMRPPKSNGADGSTAACPGHAPREVTPPDFISEDRADRVARPYRRKSSRPTVP